MNKFKVTILAVLFLFSSVGVYANYAQTIKEKEVSLNLRNKPIKSFLVEIQNQTGLNFVYNDATLAGESSKTLRAENISIEEALEELLEDTNLTYDVKNNIITIIEKADLPAIQEENEDYRTLKGKVLDSDRNPVVGATVFVIGTSDGAITDDKGDFVLNIKNNATIEVSSTGFQPVKKRITKDLNNIIIQLEVDLMEVDDVTVVGFGTQKTESMVSAVTTVRAKDLKSSSSDLTTQFAGKIAGMIGWQTGGLPGAMTEEEMNTKFYIRGITSFQSNANIDPLIIIDGVESSKLDLSRLNADDIESFSVLKDATATAMYGARGANGVIVVESKKGTEGQVYTTVSYEMIASTPTETIDAVDPITYMKAYNEATLSENPNAQLKYNSEYISRTESGLYPSFLYPNNDWYDIMFKDASFNHHMSATIRGGSQILQYYASLNHSRDQGMLKTDQHNSFDANINNQSTSFRVNLTINLAAGIQMNITTSTVFDHYQGPLTDDVASAYYMAFAASPVDLSPTYPNDPNMTNYSWPHVRFGGTISEQVNPYTEIHKGYKTRERASVTSRAEYIHRLDKLLKGLEFRASASISTQNYSSIGYETQPAKYAMDEYNFETGLYSLRDLTDGAADRVLSIVRNESVTGATTGSSQQYEARLYHTAAWDDHQTSVTAVGQAMASQSFPAQDVLNSFQQRNVSFSMRASYGYKDKYFFEGSFGYNGSERFSKEKRMGFFPAVGASWIVSKENFMQGTQNWLSNLKLRASYGRVGNDGVVNQPRFVFLEQIVSRSLTDPSFDASTFEGYNIQFYENPNIMWEINESVNVGLDAKLLHGEIEFTLDAYRQIRHNIIDYRVTIPAPVGIPTSQLDNVGKTLSYGVDLSLKWQKQFSSESWIILNNTLTYSKAKYLEIMEASAKPEYQVKIGQDISKQLGYIAEGLFVDQEEINNSPIQPGNPQPGDIRYRDLNGDGVIGVEDATFIGYPETPALIYGFNGNFFYKGFELMFSLQGSGQRSFFINPQQISPFTNDNALLQAIYDDHWTESNMKSDPFWPRMTATNMAVHNQLEDWYGSQSGVQPAEIRKSSYFLDEATFLRITAIELGYTIPTKITNKYKLQNVKFYIRTNNPFLFSNFDLWDVELGESGFNYPIQRTFSAGVNISF